MAIQLIPNNPFNLDRIYKLFILGCLIVLFLIIADMFKGCKKDEHIAYINQIKDRIKSEIKQKDSTNTIIIYRDSVRKVIVHHWHTIRKDSLIPCETKLTVCDTIIKIDSLLISDLRHEINIDDSIINNYQKLSIIDSNTIVSLKKNIKLQKVKTKFITVVGLTGWILAAIR